MRVRTRPIWLPPSAAALSVLPATAGADGFPLVGWWPMNEGSGQVVHDYSGHGNDGTLGDSAGVDAHDPAWIRGVFAGSALSFGGDDFVRIPDSTSLEPANADGRGVDPRHDSPGQFKYVVAKGATDCNSGSYGLYTSENGGLAFYIGDGTQTFVRSPEAPTTIWDGKWHQRRGDVRRLDGAPLHRRRGGRPRHALEHSHHLQPARGWWRHRRLRRHLRPVLRRRRRRRADLVARASRSPTSGAS